MKSPMRQFPKPPEGSLWKFKCHASLYEVTSSDTEDSVWCKNIEPNGTVLILANCSNGSCKVIAFPDMIVCMMNTVWFDINESTTVRVA